MSHFSVLVIGGNVDDQLAPYDEAIERAPYIRGPVSTEEKMRFLEYYANQESVKNTKKGQSHTDINVSLDDFPAQYQKYGNEWNANNWRVDSKGVWQEYSTYNPDSKWDWYTIGGRWAGQFMLKPTVAYDDDIRPPQFSWGWDDQEKEKALTERRTDSARKRDIDWEGMRKTALEQAAQQYTKFEDTVHEEIPREFILSRKEWWEENAYPNQVYPSTPQKDFKSASKLIESEWTAKCAREAGIIGFMGSTKIPTLQEYLDSQETFGTYAVLKDGVWFAKGDMGWWGLSSESEEEAEEWDKSFFDTWIKDLDDDTLLTVVDCHI